MIPSFRSRAAVALVLVSVASASAAPATVLADAAPDTQPPAVTHRSPRAGATVGTSSIVRVTFSEPVHGVRAGTLQLRDAAGIRVPATMTWNDATATATLTPAQQLAIATRYRVSLTTAITDLAGNALEPASWTFTTNRRVEFARGRYTGYRFGTGGKTIVALKRARLSEPSRARADSHRRFRGQGYLHLVSGPWAGYWVHGGPGGEARDDHRAPITPLPACGYVDLPAARQRYSAWATTVLDPLFVLPTSYSPRDLVDTSRAGLNGGHRVRSVVIDDLRAMVSAARRAGARLAVQSAYRSYHSQVATFAYWRNIIGHWDALKVSARPGHSEHQLGTTIDFRTAGGSAAWNMFDWGATREGTWMRRNAWKFGWVMSYPAGKTATSCYRHEPWHYRYVGRPLARAITRAGTTTRQVLWSLGYGVR